MTQLVHTFNPEESPLPEWEHPFFETPVKVDTNGLGALALLEDPKDAARLSFEKRKRGMQDHGTAATEHGMVDKREERVYDRFRLQSFQLVDEDLVDESLNGQVLPDEFLTTDDYLSNEIINTESPPVWNYDGPWSPQKDQHKAKLRVESHEKLAESLAELVANGRISPISAYNRYVSTLGQEDKELFDEKAAQFVPGSRK